jgi:hypothetical protein
MATKPQIRLILTPTLSGCIAVVAIAPTGDIVCEMGQYPTRTRARTVMKRMVEARLVLSWMDVSKER